jgi:hypothetical protein
VTFLHRLLDDAVARLRAEHARFALVGGLAVSVRAEPRFTRDLDFAVAVAGDAEAERLVAALAKHGYTVETLLEQQAMARLATIRLRPPESVRADATVDLLFATCGIEAEIVRDATLESVPGGPSLAVAALGHLIAMKLVAADEVRRPQDRVDLVHLVAAADDAELRRAREAVRLVEARGFGRGKDLEGELDRYLPNRDGRP